VSDSISPSQSSPTTTAQSPATGTGRVRKLSNLHVPALDGVRGLAILMVMVKHFFIGFESSLVAGPGGGPVKNLDWFVYTISKMGFVGVDLFFVLSGYLITGILLDTKGEQGFFKRFYIRRTLRIFPLYYAFLAVVFFIWPVVQAQLSIPPNDWVRNAPEHQVWYWTYTANIFFAKDQTFHGLFIMWSLCVEEQFYMVWPFVVFLLSRSGLKRACVICVFLALALRMGCVLMGWRELVPVVLMPTRIDTLAIGAWLAITAREPGGLAAVLGKAKWVLLVAVGLGGALGVAGFGGGRTGWVSAIGMTPVALAFGVLMLWVAGLPAENIIPRFFSWGVLRFFGKYAYCLYVVHTFLQGILFHYVKDDTFVERIAGSALPGRFIFVGINMVASIAVALLSWNLLEKQFLKLKRLAP
jgi:peptidoglycan/LPS O-acetylase OafA/YrhL